MEEFNEFLTNNIAKKDIDCLQTDCVIIDKRIRKKRLFPYKYSYFITRSIKTNCLLSRIYEVHFKDYLFDESFF